MCPIIDIYKRGREKTRSDSTQQLQWITLPSSFIHTSPPPHLFRKELYKDVRESFFFFSGAVEGFVGVVSAAAKWLIVQSNWFHSNLNMLMLSK